MDKCMNIKNKSEKKKKKTRRGTKIERENDR